MAPIPLTLDTEAKDLIDALRRREKDLAEYQLPRLRDCKGPLSVQQQFAMELREDLNVFAKQIDALEMHADDVARKTDRMALKQLAEEFRESSSRIRKDMRAAMLHSKKVIDLQAKSNREDLFRTATPDSRSVEEKATEDVLMRTSNDVTEALRRTIGLMQGELERSVLSHQMLEQSTASLRATSVQHDVLAAVTLGSRQLITALEKADWLDRLLVLAALAFFVLVVLFILKQRILDRGLRVAFWWTRFVPAPSFGRAGKGGDVLNLVAQEEGRATVSASVERLIQTAVETLTTALTTSTSTTTDTLLSSSPGESLLVGSNLPESLSSTTFPTSTSTLSVLTENVLQHTEL